MTTIASPRPIPRHVHRRGNAHSLFLLSRELRDHSVGGPIQTTFARVAMIECRRAVAETARGRSVTIAALPKADFGDSSQRSNCEGNRIKLGVCCRSADCLVANPLL